MVTTALYCLWTLVMLALGAFLGANIYGDTVRSKMQKRITDLEDSITYTHMPYLHPTEGVPFIVKGVCYLTDSTTVWFLVIRIDSAEGIHFLGNKHRCPTVAKKMVLRRSVLLPAD